MKHGAEEYSQSTRRAAEKYRYPAKIYDFIEQRELDHGNDMPRVEQLINAQLMSENRAEVKDGLSNVLYWGYVRQGGRGPHRVRRFRDKVTDNQLDAFVECRRRSTCAGLDELRRLKLPEFSGLSFASKVLMFMCPDSYPVLDLKIARFGQRVARRELRQSFSRPAGLSALLKLKLYATSIGLTRNNMRAYREWANWCCEVADAVNRFDSSADGALRAVDIERGIFWCIDQCLENEARRLLLGPV